jgi:hypothetical protein
MVEKLALTISEAAALGGPCRSALYQDIKKVDCAQSNEAEVFTPLNQLLFSSELSHFSKVDSHPSAIRA